MNHTGSCLCGAVRFEVEGDFESFFLCHCSRCRKATGTAHAANLFSTRRFCAGGPVEGQVRNFTVPGTRFERSFCTECGSALPRLQMGGSLLMVPAGCLDSDVAIRPVAHIHTASRANWDDCLEDIERLPGIPA